MKTLVLFFVLVSPAFAQMSNMSKPIYTEKAIMFWRHKEGWSSRLIKIQAFSDWVPLVCFRIKPKDHVVECFFQTIDGAEERTVSILDEKQI